MLRVITPNTCEGNEGSWVHGHAARPPSCPRAGSLARFPSFADTPRHASHDPRDCALDSRNALIVRPGHTSGENRRTHLRRGHKKPLGGQRSATPPTLLPRGQERRHTRLGATHRWATLLYCGRNVRITIVLHKCMLGRLPQKHAEPLPRGDDGRLQLSDGRSDLST